MKDPRAERLADILVTHSTRLALGDRVLIETFDVPPEFAAILVRRAAAAGAVPLVSLKSGEVLRALYRASSAEGFRLSVEAERHRMEQMTAYIGVRGAPNMTELADVPPEQMHLYQTHWWKPVHLDVRIPKIGRRSGVRWFGRSVVLKDKPAFPGRPMKEERPNSRAAERPNALRV